MSATFGAHFEVRKKGSPTVGGHLLGALFLLPKMDPVLGSALAAVPPEGLSKSDSTYMPSSVGFAIMFSLNLNASEHFWRLCRC